MNHDSRPARGASVPPAGATTISAAHIVEDMLDSCLAVDAEGRLAYANAAAEKRLGRSRKRLVGRPVEDAVPGPAGAAMRAALERARGEGRVCLETTLAPKGAPVELDVQPAPAGALIFIRDIGTDKRLKQALEERDERLRLAEESAGIGIWDIDLATDTVRGTAQFFRIMGLEPTGDPVPMRTLRGLRVEEDREQVNQGYVDAVASGADQYDSEYRILREGKIRWVFGRGKVVRDHDGKPLRYSGVDIDITDRKMGEIALAESEARLRLAIEASKIAVWELDVATGQVAHSPELNAVFGLPPEARPTLDELRVCVLPEDRKRAEAEAAAALARGDIQFQTEFRLKRPDGATRWALLRAQISPGGERVAGMLLDVTDRKRAEIDSQWLSAIVESSQDAIVSKTLDGIISTWNPGAEQLFGFSAGEAIGQPITIVIPENRLSEETAILDRIRRGERIDHFETVRRHKDGHLIHISLMVSPIRTTDGTVVGASKIARDITSRKEDEQRIRTLMREVNHRVKNQFAVILAMVRETNKRSASADDFETGFRERIMALSRSHDLLVSGEWRGATLRDLVHAQLEPFGKTDAISISGPLVVLSPMAVQYLGIAFHELATNAAKYGALRKDRGRLAIEWRISGATEPRLHLRWTESGGPSVNESQRIGFGKVVLERVTPSALNGTGRLFHHPTGLTWELETPLASVEGGDPDLNPGARRS